MKKPLEELHQLLCDDWQTVEYLCQHFSWRPHSLRGRICNVSVKFNCKVERQRHAGVTSYRIAEVASA